MKKPHKPKRKNKVSIKGNYPKPALIAVVLLVASIGTYLLVGSHAAAPNTSAVEAENGVVAGSATVVNDATASGGKAVSFQPAASGGACPVATPHVPGGADGMGGCWPGPGNTGVPAGTNLTTYTGPSNITTPGTIDSKIIGCIQVSVSGVVIKNSKISCNGSPVFVGDGPRDGGYFGGTPLIVQDSTIDCKNTNGTALGEANITAIRVDISGCENGGDMNQSFTVKDSYIHALFNSAEAHTDGLQGSGHFIDNTNTVSWALNITIQHNTIFGMGADGSFGTSAIISGRGGDTNWTIDSNLFAGGAYTLYCEQGAKGINYNVTNNHFSTMFGPHVGAFGPSTDCSDEVQSGNVMNETGAPITLD